MLQAAELEVALAERMQQMSEAETTLKLKEMEFERRVTNLQKEHASKVATVLHQAAAVAPSGACHSAADMSHSAAGGSHSAVSASGQGMRQVEQLPCATNTYFCTVFFELDGMIQI